MDSSIAGMLANLVWVVAAGEDMVRAGKFDCQHQRIAIEVHCIEANTREFLQYAAGQEPRRGQGGIHQETLKRHQPIIRHRLPT